jgi:transposase
MERHGLKELTAHERRELETAVRIERDARVNKRALAILHIDYGDHPGDIADALATTQAWVYRWIARYNEAGSVEALRDKPRSGRPPQMAAISDVQFDRLVAQSPLSLGYMAFAWTVPLLRGHIERTFGIALSDETVRRRLHRQDYRWKRPRYVYIETDPHKGQKKGDSFARSLWRAMRQQSSSAMKRR